MNINDLTLKYNICPLNQLIEIFGDNIDTKKTFYETFLKQTDYIAIKLYEMTLTGNTVENYDEILQYRQYCRDQINLLETSENVIFIKNE